MLFRSKIGEDADFFEYGDQQGVEVVGDGPKEEEAVYVAHGFGRLFASADFDGEGVGDGLFREKYEVSAASGAG